MKQKIWMVLLLSMFIAGCGSGNIEEMETIELPETIKTLEAAESDERAEEGDLSNAATEESEIIEGEAASTESVNSTEPEAELVEYSHEELYLSVEIPEGWEYKIRTAEEMAMEDGLVTCAIDFWSTEYPDTVFELGYHQQFGLCVTGVTVEQFVLSSGLGGYRYTELMDDIFWMNITIYNEANNVSGGSYVVSATPELTIWEAVKEEFKQILDTIWVGPRPE